MLFPWAFESDVYIGLKQACWNYIMTSIGLLQLLTSLLQNCARGSAACS